MWKYSVVCCVGEVPEALHFADLHIRVGRDLIDYVHDVARMWGDALT